MVVMEHAVLVYFAGVSSTLALAIPFVYIGVFHVKFKKISNMLEIVSHCSLLQYPDMYLIVGVPLNRFFLHFDQFINCINFVDAFAEVDFVNFVHNFLDLILFPVSHFCQKNLEYTWCIQFVLASWKILPVF